MTRVFISYSHKDEALRAELDAHLALLKREGLLDVWTDHEIPAGGDVHPSIAQGLEDADIALLLISQYFNESDYCAGIEMKRALERHAEGSCIAVPVLLRPCDWQTAPYARLNAIPRNNRPVTQWPSQDAAFAEIVKELRELLRQQAASATSRSTPAPPARPDGRAAGPSALRRFGGLFIGFATLAAVAIGAPSLVSFVRQPRADAATVMPVRPGVGSPGGGHDAGEAQTPPAGVASSTVAKPAEGDHPTVSQSPVAITSPPASTSEPRRREAAHKVTRVEPAASDECMRLTGLYAKGALGADDVSKLKEACSR